MNYVIDLGGGLKWPYNGTSTIQNCTLKIIKLGNDIVMGSIRKEQVKGKQDCKLEPHAIRKEDMRHKNL